METSDPFFRLKYIGYCTGFLPPDKDTMSYEDFVNWAKFQLAEKKGYLMEDPVWERYTNEQILAEYYAVMFYHDKEERLTFEARLKGVAQDDLDWIEQQLVKNKQEIEKIKKGALSKEPEDEEGGFEFEPPKPVDGEL